MATKKASGKKQSIGKPKSSGKVEMPQSYYDGQNPKHKPQRDKYGYIIPG